MPKDLVRSPLDEFVIMHRDAILNACRILGGTGAMKRFSRLLDDLATSPHLTRRLIREIDALDDLLSLRHVHDESRAEAGYFAEIDPASPVTEEICWLLDGLRDARLQENALV